MIINDLYNSKKPVVAEGSMSNEEHPTLETKKLSSQQKLNKRLDQLRTKNKQEYEFERIQRELKSLSDRMKPNEPGVAEDTEKPVHRIALTVTDPNHPMVSKRREQYQKSVRVTGADKEKAIASAIAHARRKGYKVHDHYYLGTVDQDVAEGTADDIKKMFGNAYSPGYAALQRVALLAMQGRQQEASGRLQSVIKDASPKVQQKIIDAVNNIKPVTVNGKMADTSALDKSKAHQEWITNTFIPWVESLLGQQGVAEGDSGARYKVKSIGRDAKGDYYISPGTGKKVYKSGVNRGDHENPKTGEIKKGVAEGSNHWHDAGVKDAIRGVKPNPRTYLSTLKDKKAKHPEEVDHYMTGYKSVKQGVAEGMADDMAAIAQKKFPNALIRKNGEEVQKPKDGGRPYTPPAQDAEKVRRDLTAKYPNIDELVRQAELRRDPTYDYAEGEAYYRGREAEQNYQRLRQIQRVIQGLNESRNPTHLP